MALNWLTHGGFSDVQPGILPLEENQQLYELAAPLKPRYWRLMAGWNYIAKQPDPGPVVAGPTYDTGNGILYTPPATRNRDWSTLDRCVNNIIRQTGAEIVMMVGQNRPRYGGGQGSGGLFQLFGGFASALSGGLFGALSAGMTSRVTAEDYGDFAAEVAERYKPGGLGIAPDLRALGYGVTKFEGWNEPNSKYTWVKNVDVKLFVEYQREFYNSVKAVSGLSGSGSTVLIGGMTHVPQGGAWYGDGWVTEQEIDFIKRAYDLGIQPYFDAMSIHPYTGQDARVTGYSPDISDNAIVQAIAIHDEMVARGDGSKPTYITEFGFSTSLCTEAEQAAYHQQAMDLVSTSLPWVTMYLVYCLRDSGSNPRALNQTLGALRHDYTTRPLWELLKSMAPQEADFNVGVTLGVGFSGTPGPWFANATVGVTLGIGMTAAAKYTAAMNVGVTLGIGMTAAEKYAAAMNVGVTLSLGISGAELGAPSTFDLPLTLGIGMDAQARYAAAMNLGVTLGIGMAAVERYAAAFDVGVTTGVGMAASDLEAGSFNLGVTLGVGMTGTGQSAAIGVRSAVGVETAGSAQTITLGTHASGDQLVGANFNSNFTTLPTLPTGWTTPTNGTRQANNTGTRVAHKNAASSSDTSGDWGTAGNAMIIAAIQNCSGVGACANTGGSGATLSTPALTLNVTDGSSAVLVFMFISNASGGNLTTPPSGHTVVIDVETGNNCDAACYIKTGVTSYAGGETVGHTVGASWSAFAVELLA